MSKRPDDTAPRDLETGLPLDRDQLLDGDELEKKINAGEISRQEADELLQAAARRHTAEHGPDLDTDEEGRITLGGFGSEQGMSSQSTATGRRSNDND
jgi:hypothetical protein